jgi:hypothetical protein
MLRIHAFLFRQSALWSYLVLLTPFTLPPTMLVAPFLSSSRRGSEDQQHLPTLPEAAAQRVWFQEACRLSHTYLNQQAVTMAIRTTTAAPIVASTPQATRMAILTLKANPLSSKLPCRCTMAARRPLLAMEV